MLRCLGVFVDERYDKLSEIGRGGMGVVFKARDRRSGATVAVKVLQHAGLVDRARFEREQKLLSSLGAAEGFVPSLDHGAEGPEPWIVMPFLDGGTLEQRIRSEALPVAEVVALGRRLARALGHAHAAGIVHRDVKPANVLFTKAGDPLVSDLGLGKRFRKDVPGVTRAESLTQSGELFGTLHYMAPEQLLDSKTVGPPADVFSLGVLLYECLTRAKPFPGNDPVTLLTGIEGGRLTPLASVLPGIPPEVAAVVERCLRAKADERFANGHALEEALAALDVRRRVAVWPSLLALVLVGGLGAVAKTRAPATEWQTVWRSADGPRPSLEPRALWEDAEGRVAAPLAGIEARDPEKVRAAFRGAVQVEDSGRVTFTPDLGAMRCIAERPGVAIAFGPYVLGRTSERFETSGTYRARNMIIELGDARWRSPRIAFAAESRQAEQPEFRGLAAGVGESGLFVFMASRGPSGELVLGPTTTLGPGPGRHAFVYAPGAAPSEAVRVDDRPVPVLGETAGAVPPGQAYLKVSGSIWEVSGVTVSGLPERTDVPAAAVVPGAGLGDARVEASFARERQGLGGPFVALASGKDDALRLELDGGELVLSRGWFVLARARAGAAVAAGSLRLERAGGLVRGSARGEGFSAQVEAADPLPSGAARATYGSTAPRVRFSDVVVATPVVAAERGPDAAARTAWREGALLLARAADFARVDPGAVGPGGWERRRALAKDARRLLLEAAPGLRQATLRRDALARALHATVLAGLDQEAGDLARRFVKEEGAEVAAATVDALEQDRAGPGLLRRFLEGYVDYERKDGENGQDAVLLAGAVAVEVLQPSARGATALLRARCLYARKHFDAAIEQCRRAEELGAIRSSVHALWGDTHMERAAAAADREVGRVELEEACLHWEQASDVLVARGKLFDLHYSLGRLYQDRAHERLVAGASTEALEESIGALAHEADRRAIALSFGDRLRPDLEAERGRAFLAVLEQVRSLAERLVASQPGLAAAAHIAANRAEARWAARAAPSLDAARPSLGMLDLSVDGPDRDLILYAASCLGEDKGAPPAEAKRPTAELVRVRRAKGRGGAELAAAKRESPLVEHLARLDEAFAR